MFCSKCGKQTEDGATLCKECAQKTQPAPTATASIPKEPNTTYSGTQDFYRNPYFDPTKKPYQPSTQPQVVEQQSNKEGFGGALAATIMGSIALFVGFFLISFMLAVLEEIAKLSSNYYYIFKGNGILYGSFFVCLGLAIPSLILGAKGIRAFGRAKDEGRPAPVASKVCGIIGIATSSAALLLGIVSLVLRSTI